MTHEVIMAGFGGQGVMAMGKILAETALKKGKNVSWLPSYGPEMRGGTANCNVIVSDDIIGAPVVTSATAVLALNKPSMDKFEDSVVPGGALLVNSSLINKESLRRDIKAYYIPATDIANEIGNSKIANMIMLGAYLEVSGVALQEEVFEIVAEIFSSKKQDLIRQNKEALSKGALWIKEH